MFTVRRELNLHLDELQKFKDAENLTLKPFPQYKESCSPFTGKLATTLLLSLRQIRSDLHQPTESNLIKIRFRNEAFITVTHRMIRQQKKQERIGMRCKFIFPFSLNVVNLQHEFPFLLELLFFFFL